MSSQFKKRFSQPLPKFPGSFLVKYIVGLYLFFVLFSQFLLPLPNAVAQYVTTAAVMFAIGVLVDSIWLGIGSSIQALFAHPRYARAIRVLFGLSIVVATVWALSP